MLQGYNILEFYTSLDLRVWDDLENKYSVFSFTTNNIPPFFLVSTEYSTDSTTVQVFDANTNSSVGDAQAVATVDNTTYMTYKFLGASLSGGVCGDYYLKIVNGINTFYSEVFRWEDDLTTFIRITATSNSLTMGNRYTLDFSGITFDCYVSGYKAITELEIDEEGVEKPFGNIPVFNTLNTIHKFDIFGNGSMLRFLFGLRILETNGSIAFVYNGQSMSAYDITAEKGDVDGYDKTNVIGVMFKEQNYISSKNI
jgi:hypothetical protein